MWEEEIHVSRRVFNAVSAEVVSCDVKIEYLAQTFVSFCSIGNTHYVKVSSMHTGGHNTGRSLNLHVK
jgi:hypothetical protein